LEFIRNGCLRESGHSTELSKPPPIILPYFGIVRIADTKINTRPILEEDFNPPKPQGLALHPPPPAPTIPQVQDEFYAMNMENEFNIDQPFGGAPLNWDFNFAMNPGSGGANAQVGGIPMDIEAWSSVSLSL
jgi:hypothetical protein